MMKRSTFLRGGTVPLGEYLFTRLKQMGVGTIFGVPGDFNLTLLDHIYNVPGLRWAGNTNELNASYAADGYSRVKRFAALITTFGVGELSALAGTAGSYSEHVGMIHIVGIPSVKSQDKHLLLHHTLGDGDFNAFLRMSVNISAKADFIRTAGTAATLIDDMLLTAYRKSRPVYLGIPSDMSETQLEKDPLSTPLPLAHPPNDPTDEKEAIEAVIPLVKAAKKPVIIVDACASRHKVVEETNAFADATQFPVFVTPMGKGCFDENDPRFGGMYVGKLSDPKASEIVEASDLILSIGTLSSDFNTGAFTSTYHTDNIIEFHSDSIKVRRAVYPGVRMGPVIEKLTAEIKAHPPKEKVALPGISASFTPQPPETPLSQEYLWSRLSKFLRPTDIIVTETGTSSFGITTTRFPKNAIGISQVLWGSIGYSVGSMCGAVMAAQEISPDIRVLLFVGDGSLQLTVTEFSTMCRWNTKPYLFILNNDGYTIERMIHGPEAGYNDVHMWKYSQLLDTFNAPEGTERLQARTVGDLDGLFNDAEFNKPSKMRSIEVFLPKLDAPKALIKQGELSEALNKG